MVADVEQIKENENDEVVAEALKKVPKSWRLLIWATDPFLRIEDLDKIYLEGKIRVESIIVNCPPFHVSNLTYRELILVANRALTRAKDVNHVFLERIKVLKGGERKSDWTLQLYFGS